MIPGLQARRYDLVSGGLFINPKRCGAILFSEPVLCTEEGFLVKEDGSLRILPLGQVFIRNVAMVFDTYLRRPEGHRVFSRTV